ncbi:unnamed protein product [Linum tenue]|uniref:FAS1 domain-containing protein n=1 Tax=Linum tenue TaxID=586396 RepID=A0AAV0KG15_9ROSI|nr:unnamed protein product [Linum tenue]
MANSIHLALLSFLFLAAVGSCSAFNVTQVLGPLRQFSTFSNYLAQVGVVGMMTNLKNVTILAVDNANMGSISGKSREEIKRAMTMHVIPEYYDLDRLRSLENGTALIRTIYVLTGLARGKDGMLLVTKRGKGGRISFASAILPRSKPSTVTLLRSVVVPSLNVSIFQVSGVIVSPPPVVSVASEGAGADSAGRIAVSSKLVARREFPAVNKKTLKPDGDEEKEEEDDIKTSEKAASKGDEESAPAKAPSKAPSKSPSKNASPPKKSPAKAPSPSKSSNSTSGGKKGKSTAPAPSPSSDSPAPAPSKKKKSDSPSPAPSKDAPSKSPAASKSPKAPADSSSDDSPAPSKSSKGGSSSESPDSSSSPSPSDDYYAKSSPPAPAKGSESPSAESPSDEAEAPAEAPSGGASPMSVTNVGIMMTVMALWALAA